MIPTSFTSQDVEVVSLMSGNKPETTTVRKISPDLIERNPENPRLIWKHQEMEALLGSIEQSGILVPLIVYPDDGKFRLLDGERRLRLARRLNLREIPVNIVAKPTRVENILQMFHIHNVRVSWELIETAKKLGVLLQDPAFEGKSVRDIARLTGLTPTTVSRCKELLALDPSYQEMILNTYRRLEKGEEESEETSLTEDFFIESKHAIKSVKKFLKDISTSYEEKALLDKFIDKRKSGTFSNVVEIGHTIPKIVAAARKGASQEKITAVVTRLIEDPDFTIGEAYKIAAQPVLESLDVEKRCANLIVELGELRQFRKNELEWRKEQLVKILKELRNALDETLSLLR